MKNDLREKQIVKQVIEAVYRRGIYSGRNGSNITSDNAELHLEMINKNDRIKADAQEDILSLIKKEKLALLDEVMEKVKSVGDGVTGTWAKHAYSMEAYAIDTLVYSGKATKEQEKIRNDNVTDRRAILLSSHLVKEQVSALQAIRDSVSGGE